MESFILIFMLMFFVGIALWAVLLKGFAVIVENRRLRKENIELEKRNLRLLRHNEALRGLL